MDTELRLQFIPEHVRTPRATHEPLANAGGVVAEIPDAGRQNGEEPSSREIADAIVRWLRTGERGQ
jgi:hypothetical protein